MRIDNDIEYREYIEQMLKAEEEINGYGMESEISGDGEETIEKKDYPYRVEDIRIDFKMLSVYQLYRWIQSGMLVLRPEFQRKFVWNKQKQSLLIESLMLKIPIPAFYFDEDLEGKKTVIDGLQRLTTISNFMNGDFKLCGLQYLSDCEGCRFFDLDKKYQMRIEDTQLAVNVLDAKCPSAVKFDVFRRINTGGMPLNTQEVRNIMANPHTRELLVNMATDPWFSTATRNRIKDIRMGAQELCLRYITYDYIYDAENKCFNSFGDMTDLLDRMIVKLNGMGRTEHWEIELAFAKSMEKCYTLFGEAAFSKPKSKSIINRALFTSFSIVLTHDAHSLDWLDAHQEKAKELLEYYLEDDKEYFNAITSSTSSRKNMEVQFKYANRLLEELAE